MNETADNFSIIVSRGNTFVMRWGLIAIFVHFTVVVPYFDSVENYRIGETQKLIDMQIRDYQKLLPSKDDLSKKSEISIHGVLPSKNNINKENEFKIRGKIISLQKSHLELEAKKKSRGISVPFLDIQINKNAIILFYPSLIFGGLIWLLRLRSKLIELAIQSRSFKMPIWAAPFPHKIFNGHFSIWILSNVTAITFHIILISWVLDFFWKVRNTIRYEFFAVFLMVQLH